ncbi:hypothetical protein HAX54_015901 [Datura stramonium]|uniref:AAA+ ATPase domain-containing protein n=1 Tax=Datura stramonium TaxID=4076 RepID=A0ABS8UHZ7_DATST|nr:hypothetical protein [Datura stramonium]
MRDITKPSADGGRSGWEDVGGLNDIRNAIIEMIELRQISKYICPAPLRMRSNVLLYGPPGCGKTHIVGAAAAACSLRFISVKGPELLNKYIGASEQAVRDIFSKAAATAPCLLFLMNLILSLQREAMTTLVLLIELLISFSQVDGVEVLTGVFVFAATSSPTPCQNEAVVQEGVDLGSEGLPKDTEKHSWRSLFMENRFTVNDTRRIQERQIKAASKEQVQEEGWTQVRVRSKPRIPDDEQRNTMMKNSFIPLEVLDPISPRERDQEFGHWESSHFIWSFTNGKDKYETVCLRQSRPDLLDAALLRPGRLDRLLFCDFPSQHERSEILSVLSRKLPLASDVDLDGIAHLTEGFSGADLQALLSDAQLEAVHDLLDSENVGKPDKKPVISDALLKSIASKAKPSVSDAEKQRLYDIYSQFLDSKRSVAAQSRDAKGKRATLA